MKELKAINHLKTFNAIRDVNDPRISIAKFNACAQNTPFKFYRNRLFLCFLANLIFEFFKYV